VGLRGLINGSALTADETIDISSEMRFPGTSVPIVRDSIV
jgi:hypothetical protein